MPRIRPSSSSPSEPVAALARPKRLRRAELFRGSLPHVKWGTTLADFDNAADRGAFIARGHFIEHIQRIDDRTAVRVPNFLLENQGNGRLDRISPPSGS